MQDCFADGILSFALSDRGSRATPLRQPSKSGYSSLPAGRAAWQAAECSPLFGQDYGAKRFSEQIGRTRPGGVWPQFLDGVV